MLYEILKHLRNFFPDVNKQMVGRFKVEEGMIYPFPILLNGQYVLIEGSTMNDGIYKAPIPPLVNEEFDGVVTPLKVPKDLLSLVEEIEAFQADNKPSPYTSESFGGYSYSKATNASGNQQSWQNAFGTRLNAWRKM